MPKAKNLGPCIIPDCTNAVKFNKMTNYTIEKVKNKDLEEIYSFIKEGDQLCYIHYLEIVEPDRNDKKRKSTEELNDEYSKNIRARAAEESYGKPSYSKSIDEL